MPRKRNYIEDIATLPLDFCRETKVSDDIYQIGLLIPNNDICSERSTQGYERIIVICKNRQHHADVLELKISETQLAVKYVTGTVPAVGPKNPIRQTAPSMNANFAEKRSLSSFATPRKTVPAPNPVMTRQIIIR